MSPVPLGRFIMVSGIGSLVWATVVDTGGYLFGSALQAVIGEVKCDEVEVLFAIAIIGLLVWIVHLYRGRKRTTSSQSSQNS